MVGIFKIVNGSGTVGCEMSDPTPFHQGFEDGAGPVAQQVGSVDEHDAGTLSSGIADALSASLDLCHRMGGKGGRARMRIQQDVLDRSQAFPLVQWLHQQVVLPEGSSDGF